MSIWLWVYIIGVLVSFFFAVILCFIISLRKATDIKWLWLGYTGEGFFLGVLISVFWFVSWPLLYYRKYKKIKEKKAEIDQILKRIDKKIKEFSKIGELYEKTGYMRPDSDWNYAMDFRCQDCGHIFRDFPGRSFYFCPNEKKLVKATSIIKE